MARFIDPLYTNSFLDANIFDEIAGGAETLKLILAIYDGGQITLLLPYSVQQELEVRSTPDSVRRAAANFNYSVKVQLTKGEIELYEKLLAEARGDADPKNIDRDLFHVFEAAKYGGGHFITRDKGLLKRAEAIASQLGIEVVTPKAFVEQVQLAREREAEFARRKQQLPEESQ